MSEKIEIDITSDTVCPWCYIGKRRLEKALEQLQVTGCFTLRHDQMQRLINDGNVCT